MAENGYDLKINVLNSNYDLPKNKNYKNIWFNLYGIEKPDTELINFMAQICEDNKEAKKLIINANEKIKEELRVFSLVHKARFIQ